MPSNVRSRYLYNASGDSPFRADQYIYDPLAVMAAIAARTARVADRDERAHRPVPQPTGAGQDVGHHRPHLHGRIILGIGVGWMAEEFDALGLGDQWPQRGRVTDEYMAVCIDLWTQDGPSSFDGEWVSYRDVGANPLPVRSRTSRSGSAASPAGHPARRPLRLRLPHRRIDPGAARREIAAVHEAMELAGRDPAELTVSMLWGFSRWDGRGDDRPPRLATSRRACTTSSASRC